MMCEKILRSLRYFGVIAMCLPFIFCGDGGDGYVLNQEQFTDLYAKYECARIFNCCDTDERKTEVMLLTPKPSNEADCIPLMANRMATFFNSILAENWDGQGAGSCSKLLKDRITTCSRDFPSCHITKATKGPGDSCENYYECQDGTACLNKYCVKAPLAEEKKADGEVCSYDWDCKSDACVSKKCLTTTTYKCDGKG